ncbi:Sau3AI family type II restriction endonuclease [Halobacillus sp. SY10]|uniref:DNA mismatch repair protein MutH n=1 Tax=Halobacillus aidingensis TaxID=240303 RepID=A0A1H0M184_HALAD|nr:Sau3AI family type II restriction endonuclease [Halobacillus aidingensis]SDO74218.1 DNA mismatch repair protein MutH [Halobacillus aidingensis]
MIFETEGMLLEYTEGIVGRTFREIDKTGILEGKNSDKGRLGKAVEEGFYGYELNSNPEADFDNLGIELKVSGFNRLKDGSWSAKERLSLSMINYNEIIHEEFEFSKLIAKNKKILIIWYEYVKGVEYADFVIRDYQIYDMTKDEKIIENDFNTIKQKVIEGEAHKLSEGDSVILGAATKGQKGQKAGQPNSHVLAPTRAFSLKNSFFRGILRDHLKGVTYHHRNLEFVTPESYVWNRITRFRGMSQLEILESLTGRDVSEKVPKQIGKMVSDALIGKDKDLADRHEVFSKSTYMIKNIPVKNGTIPMEKATFSTLKFEDFSTDWEESEWKTFFEEVTFLYITWVGQKDGVKLKNGERLLDRVYKITFTEDEVESFRKTYDLIKKAIEQRDISFLPKSSSEISNGLDLVISTKSNKGGVYERFFEDKKENCFMLNKDFIKRKLEDATRE